MASGSFLIFSIAFKRKAKKIETKNAAKVTMIQSFPRLGPDFISGIEGLSRI